MSDQQHSGFGQFIPGFDFLQNLARGGAEAMPQMPGLSNWIAPTLNVEELDKRIGELKAVRFWLEQNATAVGATIQALEVQKMTLATLQGMNVKMADLAESMKFKPDAAAPAAPKAAEKGAQTRGSDGEPDEAKVVDPLQWWGALTQQFQQIAATAMQEVAATADGATKAAAPAPARAASKAAATKNKRPPRKTAAS
ncbi:MAG TPA: PhaM family polyhydroxyalkanoate granule multifunctional regulatory protein [Ramlibacter sp.]